MKIGIDFDRVLFKTGAFKQFLEEEIPGFLEEYPDKPVYNPAEHAEKLGIDAEEIMEALSHADEFLYDDVEVLEKLKQEHELLLVSRGVPSFQGKKIANSGVCELFDVVMVLEHGSKDRVDIDFLVDDRDVEHEKTEVPGFCFDRKKHTVEDIIERVKDLETRKSV